MALLKFFQYDGTAGNPGQSVVGSGASGSFGAYTTFATASPEDVESLEVMVRSQTTGVRYIIETMVDSGSVSQSFEWPLLASSNVITTAQLPFRVPRGYRLRSRCKASVNNATMWLGFAGQTNTPFTITGAFGPTLSIPGNEGADGFNLTAGVVRPFRIVSGGFNTASYGEWIEVTSGTTIDSNVGLIFIQTNAAANGTSQLQVGLGASGSEIPFIEGLAIPLVNGTETKQYFNFYNSIPSGSRVSIRCQTTPITQSLTTAITLFNLPTAVSSTGSIISGSSSSGSTIIPSTPMERIIRRNESTASLRTVLMSVINTDGTSKTNLAAGKAQLSYDGATSVTSSNNFGHVENGYYSLTLTSTEVNVTEGTNITSYIPNATGYVTVPAHITVGPSDIFTSSITDTQIASTIWSTVRGSPSTGTFGYFLDSQVSTSTGSVTGSFTVDSASIASAVRTNLTPELSRIDVVMSSRLSTSSYSAPPTTQSIASAVWTTTRGTQTSGSFGFLLDVPVSVSTGSFSGSTTVDSASIAAAVWAQATRSITDVNTTVTNKIANDLLDLSNSIETGSSLRGILRLVGAALLGTTSGSLTNTITFKNAVADNKVRITATLNSTTGNRDSITVDLS